MTDATSAGDLALSRHGRLAAGACLKRPCNRRATEKDYELPPLHCRPLTLQFAPAMTLP